MALISQLYYGRIATTTMRIFFTFLLLFGVHLAQAQIPTPALAGCGYQMQLTAVGTHLVGTLISDAPQTSTTVSNVKWLNAATNKLVGLTTDLNYPASNYGVYSIKATFLVANASGQVVCSGQLTDAVEVLEPVCAQPAVAYNNVAPCNIDYAPVCGCDGITYANQCMAEAAGITQWWANECTNQPPVPLCGTTNLDATIISGSPQTGYDVQFDNLSAGVFSNMQLDFGDGTPIYESALWVSTTHHYAASGNYQANLTTWNNNQPGCVASVSRLVSTDSWSTAHAALPVADYARPGDTNGDLKANMYDLLNIGLGYAETGVPRPDPSLTFVPQIAPNWPDATLSGVNYKHLDCNGDGVINEFDVSAIALNYQQIDTSFLPVTNGKPELWVDFDQNDTIYIDTNNPQPLEINANIMLGSLAQPVFNLYGLAFALNAPEYIAHDPNVLYDASFFGPSNYTLLHTHDNYASNHLDLGFSQKSGQGASGYGRLAQVTYRADFIIIIDIIDRAENKVVPFIIPVEGVRAVDSTGVELKFSSPSQQDTIWVKMAENVSNVQEQTLANKIKLAPNPATDHTLIYTANLDVYQITAYNALGQLVNSIPYSGQRITTVDLTGWQPGYYTFRIQTSTGVVEKRLLIIG